MPYVVRRGRLFHFRIRVPDDLRGAFRRRELRASVRESCHRSATTRASILALHSLKFFAFLRYAMKRLSPDEIAALIAAWRERMLGRDSEVRAFIEAGLTSRSLYGAADQYEATSDHFADLLRRLVPAPYDPTLPESEIYSPTPAERDAAFAEAVQAMTATADEPEDEHLPLLDHHGLGAVDAPSQRLLAVQYAQAARDLYSEKRDRCMGIAPHVALVPTAPAAGNATAPGPTGGPTVEAALTGRAATPLATAWGAYVAERRRTSGAWAAGTPDKAIGAYADLLRVLGNVPVAKVTREMCEAYRTYAELRGNRKRAAKCASGVEDVLAGSVHPSDRRAPKTVQDELDQVSRFFAWLHECHYISASPAVSLMAGAHVKKARVPWTDAEIAKMLDPGNWQGFLAAKRQQRARDKVAFLPWLIVLGVYTGARIGELAGLRPCDVQQRHAQSEGNVPVILIEPHSERRLKSASATRAVPIHPDLVELGLLDLAERRKRMDAASLLDVPGKGDRRGNAGTQAFAEYTKHLGIHVEGQKVFHSLRHGLKTKLEGPAVKTDVDLLLGHRRADSANDAYTHADQVPLDRHYKAVSQLRTGINIAALKPLLDEFSAPRGGTESGQAARPSRV